MVLQNSQKKSSSIPDCDPITELVRLIVLFSPLEQHSEHSKYLPSHYGFGFLFRWILNVLNDLVRVKVHVSETIRTIRESVCIPLNNIPEALQSVFSEFLCCIELADIHLSADTTALKSALAKPNRIEHSEHPVVIFSRAYYHFVAQDYQGCISILDMLLSKELISATLRENSYMLLGNSMLMAVHLVFFCSLSSQTNRAKCI